MGAERLSLDASPMALRTKKTSVRSKTIKASAAPASRVSSAVAMPSVLPGSGNAEESGPASKGKRHGGRRPLPIVSMVFAKDASEQIRLCREGVPSDAVDKLASRLQLSRAQFVAAISLPLSTIERRVAAKRPLSPAESNRIYRVEKVLARTLEVLEDESASILWVQLPLRSLGGVSPLSLLDTNAGVDLVLATLTRIEQGVVA